MKGNATVLLDLWAKEKKKSCRAVFFFFFCPVFELYQSENHCYSKSFALFCLEAQDLQCQLSPILLDSKPARQPANGWMSQSGAEGGWGWGGVSTECLFAVVLWVSGSSPTVQNFLLGSTWPFLHLKQSPPPHNWPIVALCRPQHLPRGGSTSPYLSVLWHRDHFSWKMY